MTFAYVGLGGNMGRPQRQLATAVRLLKRLPATKITGISPVYLSAPVGCPGQQKFYYNAVTELQTTLAPQRLFLRLRKTERAVQRRRRCSNAPRRLDVDYLKHGNAVLRGRFLVLPHPRMTQRAFVMRPLVDILQKNRRPLYQLNNARHALKQCARQKLKCL